MWPFSSKPVNSEEYERLSKKFSDVLHELEDAKAKISKLDQELATIRARVNRKIGGEVEEKKEEKYQGQFIPEEMA